MAAFDPKRVEQGLNNLWNSTPGLFEDLAIAAVDQEMLSVDEVSKLLLVDEREVETRLFEYRQRAKNFDALVIHDEMRKAACLVEGGVMVWEVVLEYRKLGSSLEELKSAFPSLSERDLACALRYAESHADEIEGCISDYELIRAKRKAEYPFSH
jgi:uncharacterized protein (DUF433 family)